MKSFLLNCLSYGQIKGTGNEVKVEFHLQCYLLIRALR